MSANLTQTATSSGELSFQVAGVAKTINLFDDATGEMKNTYTVFEEINKYWQEMSSAEKENLAISIAGKNHMEVFLATMNNFGSVTNATKSAILSQGSALRENEAVLDSFEGHISRFAAAYENLATRIVDSDIIKGVIDFGTNVINIMGQIADSTIAKGALITAALVALNSSFNLIGKAGMAFTGITSTFSQLSAVAGSVVSSFSNVYRTTRSMGSAVRSLTPGFAGLIKQLKTFTMVGLGVVAVTMFTKALQQQEKEFNTLQENVNTTKDKLEELNSEAEALSSKGSLTAGEEARLSVLNAEIAANETLLRQEAQKQFQYQYEGRGTTTGGLHGAYEATGVDSGTQKLQSQITTLQNLETQWQNYENQIASLDKNAPGYTDKVLELSEAQDKVKKSMDETAASTLSELYSFKELYDMTGIQNDAYDELIAQGISAAEAYQTLASSVGEGTEANGIFANSFAEVEEEANLATEALQAYATASELPEYDANFKSYSDAWNTLNGEIEAGRTHSRAFQAAAELLFGQDWLERVNYSTDAIKTQTEALRQFFESGESGGANLINTLDSMTNSEGQIVTATGEVIGQFKQLEDGASVLELPNENLAKLAETLGMDEGALVSMLQAWNMFGEGFSMFDTANLVEDLGNAGKAFGDFADGSGKAVVNLDEVRAELEASDKSAWEIHDILQQISNDPAVITVEGEQSVDDAYNMVHELGLEIESVDGESINISTESLSNLIQVMGLSESQAEELVGKLSQIDGVTFVDAAGNAQTMSQALQTVSSAAEGASNASGAFKGAMDNAINAAKIAAQARPFDQAKASADNATSSVQGLNREINALPTRKTITIVVNKIKNYDEEATGTSSAPGGLTLVGEEYAPDGKPRPELVVANGKARLVGTDGPEFINLPKGAQVYPYKKTKEMLRNGHLPEEVDAYAEGANIDAVRQQATGGTSSSSSSKKPTTSSGSGSSSGSKSKTPSVSSQSKASDNKALKEQNDLFKEQIDIMEHNLFLMQKRGASIQEQTEYMVLMQQELNNQANYFRSKGVAENDEFIRTLQKQWKQSTTFIQ